MSVIARIAIALALAIALGLLLRYDEGVVSIILPPHRIDLAANMVLLSLIAGFVALYFLLRIVGGTLRLPRRFSAFGQRRRHASAVEAFNASVLALNEGRYEQAGQMAQRAQADQKMAGPAALVAARAAHALGAVEDRNKWLDAIEGDQTLDRARQVFLAEAALDDEKPADALVALSRARALGADSVQTLRLELRANELAADWHAVLANLKQLVKRRAMTEEVADKSRARAWQALFAEAAGDAGQVAALHKQLSRRELKIDGVAESVAEALATTGEHSRAAKLVESVMTERLSPRMLVLYTRLDAIPARDRLRVAEGWLARYADGAGRALVLAALGRLCMAQELWGKAEEFLKEANELAPSPYTRLALAEMYDQLGRGDEASGLYRSLAHEQRLALKP